MHIFGGYYQSPSKMNTAGNLYPEEISQATKSLRFKTKKGHCYMLEDRLVITNNRKISLEDAFKISWCSRVKIGIFMITASASLIFTFVKFFSGEKLTFSILHLLLTLVLGYLVKRQMDTSSVKIIYKKDIMSADFYGATFRRKKSFFEVIYYENVLVKCTHLVLPKKNTSGGSNTQKALEIMHEL